MRSAHAIRAMAYAAIALPIVIAVPAGAARFEPERIDLLVAKEGKPEECGIAADYLVSGAILGIELAGIATSGGIRIVIRAYEPNAVGPIMNDIWLKTTSLFTPPRFKQARLNENGILEASGEVDRKTGVAALEEIARGEAEIAIIFDGVLPASRMAVGLPSPLPGEVRGAVVACAREMAGER